MCAKKWEEKVFETLGNGTDGGRFPTRESSHEEAAANLQVLPTWYIWIEKILREEVLPTWYDIWIEKKLGEETPTDNEDQIIVKSNIWTLMLWKNNHITPNSSSTLPLLDKQ